MQRTDGNSGFADFIGKAVVFLVLGAVIAAISSIGSCGLQQPSSEGMGGDPNPTEQYADPCSSFESRCDAGTNPGDLVPDRNGEVPDRNQQ